MHSVRLTTDDMRMRSSLPVVEMLLLNGLSTRVRVVSRWAQSRSSRVCDFVAWPLDIPFCLEMYKGSSLSQIGREKKRFTTASQAESPRPVSAKLAALIIYIGIVFEQDHHHSSTMKTSILNLVIVLGLSGLVTALPQPIVRGSHGSAEPGEHIGDHMNTNGRSGYNRVEVKGRSGYHRVGVAEREGDVKIENRSGH